ncbi:Bug family tripartite tricarboxylate transporter substrate binding protein [Rhodoplanes sp. Z2-YC6860]|uniref:Bug family tripartite tricarboxylate transporter substrate binding protein n=1 Tax=Rhodoplanes sp. Z2-YC6860 TaxID=674703 RepID=UPI00078CABA2|nr:tripartite tricarboxylate transporter substrate binding protein [Rhodoplanes sp. Z2-YC6860]AMN44369.1 extra-cytoplasmic solute receptor [Rhodoplanes sp. Z2-YC6860]
MARPRLAFLAILIAAVTSSRLACAAEWPDRPLRLIVPFSAGSSSDTIARIVAAKMADSLGQAVIVENRVGGSAIIGTDAVAKSAPDGYTLGLANTTSHAASVALTPKLPFDVLKDFVPVGMIGQSPFVLVGSPNLPAATLAEFVGLAKAKPGSLSYASAGTGTLAHLAGELFKHKAGIDVVHVSYRGTEQSTLDLMQGRIDLSVSTIAPTLQQIRGGKIKALAVMDVHRNEMMPDVPTVAEAGVAGCEAELWTALVVPAGVPSAVVGRLNQALNAAVRSTAVQDTLRIQGVEPLPGPPEAVTAAIKADIQKWRDIVVAAKIGEQK